MPVEILWYGHGCFRLRGSQGTVVTDPIVDDQLLLPNLKADVVTLSRPAAALLPGSARGTKALVIDGPGEYERQGILIVGLPIGQARLAGTGREPTVAYAITIDDVTICHLGELGHRPSQSEVEALGVVDVLLVPVGGGTMLSAAKAAEVVGLIDPSIVVPMHYRSPEGERGEPVERFLREVGAVGAQPQDSLRVQGGRLSEELQVVVLQQRR